MSVTLVSGANNVTANLAGRTVSDVVGTESIKSLLGLDGSEVVTVDGEAVDNDHTLDDGEEIRFEKVAGTKG